MTRPTKLFEALSGMVFFVLAGAVARAQDPTPSATGSAAPASPQAPTALPSAPSAGPPRVASYVITARLDDSAHRVTATGTITWKNASRAPVSELYLHLYMNAFKNQRSLFLRSPFAEGRSGAQADDWGYVDVERLVARELGTDLWPSRMPGTPEDPNDETDVRVPLPRAVGPGETLTLDVAFTVKLPAVIERTGYAGRFHFAGQWFPKLARLENDGTWVHFRFHPQAEFYADFGDYDVTLDVPKDAVVGASGKLVETRAAGARRIERYQAGPVHDFAWVAWPGFRELRERVGSVDVRVLYPPDCETDARVELDAVRAGLPRFSRLFGEYPYPTLTVVHPPDAAASTGGMEYPTLITTGGPWFGTLLGARAVESVTLHELLHQWFYGIVATNEERFPFLDEGITTYAEISALDALYGNGSAYHGFGFDVRATTLSRTFAASRSEDVPVALPAADFPGFRTLAALVYSRTGTALETLARVYGRDKVDRAIGSYARQHRFGHPTPEALIAAIRAELGERAALVLELALVRRGRLDYVVRELQTAEERAPAGVFDDQGKRRTVQASDASAHRFRGRVVVYRHGELELPVDVELTDSQGGRSRQRWDGQGTHHVFDWQGDFPLAFAVVDPDRRILLDDDLLNNAAALESLGPTRTLERGLYLAELLLGFFGP